MSDFLLNSWLILNYYNLFVVNGLKSYYYSFLYVSNSVEIVKKYDMIVVIKERRFLEVRKWK